MAEFRISMWPGYEIPIPEVLVPDSLTVVDHAGESGGPFLLHCEASEDTWYRFSLPPDELYLREVRDLDVVDPDAMAAFIRKYGRLGLREWYELPEVYKGHAYSGTLSLIDGPRDDFYDRMRARLRVIDAQECMPLAEAALYVKLVRDLTRVWEYTTGLLSFSQVVQQWENGLWYKVKNDAPMILKKLGLEDSPDLQEMIREEHPDRDDLPEELITDHPEEPDDLYIFMDEILGAALEGFHVRPLIYKTVIDEDGETIEAAFGRSDPLISLYGALCLQLANHMAENAQYRTCQKCDRLFYRQQGRARFGQHHTKGERLPQYCSWSCAHAAAQAQYKKRKIAASEKAEKDTTAIR